jgi:hypothetical protein
LYDPLKDIPFAFSIGREERDGFCISLTIGCLFGYGIEVYVDFADALMFGELFHY